MRARSELPLLAIAVVAAAIVGAGVGGCAADKNVGAVVVRWRIVDALSGAFAGGCTIAVDAPPDAGTTTAVTLTVDQVQLTVAHANDESWFQQFAPVACTSCLFCCGPREGTTEFEIPVDPTTGSSTYEFGVRALRCGHAVGNTPPPVVRTVRAGEVTNLGAVEILVPPTQPGDETLCEGVDMAVAPCR